MPNTYPHVIVFLLLVTSTAWNQSAVLTADERVQASKIAFKQRHFVEYQQDFLDYAKSGRGTEEYEYAFDLQRIAADTGDQLDVTGNMLLISATVYCKEDRTRISPLIREQIHTFSQYMALSIKAMNIDIANTKSPGVAAEAIRMRSDLREAKDLLDSIKLP